jgi:hypothetical protein
VRVTFMTHRRARHAFHNMRWNACLARVSRASQRSEPAHDDPQAIAIESM